MSVEHPIKALVAVGFSSSQASCDADSSALTFLRSLQDRWEALEIIAVAAGAACAEEALLAALARGADRAIKIETDIGDPRATSRLIAAVIRRERPNLTVLGERGVEDIAGQAGPRIAAILGLPHAGGVRELDILPGGKSCRVVREMDGRRERLQLTLPSILSVDISIDEIPLLSLYEIVAARSKPIKRIKGASLAAHPAVGYSVLRSERASIVRKGRIVANVDELITVLREEAHVI